MPADVLIRPAQLVDLPFVQATWKRSARREFPAVRTSDFYRVYGAHVDDLIQRWPVQVACNRDAHEHLYGWACGGDGTLHFVYVKRPLRGFGIGSALLEAIGWPPVTSFYRRQVADAFKARGYAPRFVPAFGVAA